MGLNITVWSYAGHMNFTLVGCMRALPDIYRIADGLGVAMEASGSKVSRMAQAVSSGT